MDPITALAASGLRARMESLEMLANNVANASTSGFKADREFYSLYAGSVEEDNGSLSTMPVIERPWTDHAQGTLLTTGNPLDLALDGKGFFAVNGPSGPLYTRNGNFRLSADGRLVTGEGYAVRDRQGAALALDASRSVQVTADGTVTQEGRVIGQLEVVDFNSLGGLTKQGSTYFRIGDPALQPTPSNTAIQQGQLEGSNAGPAEAAVRLISVMRQFEMLNKAVTMGAEMNKRAIEEVAKV